MAAEQAHILDEINTFIASLKSVQMATLNPDKQAEISYTPFLRQETQFLNQFYIFISELALHTQNLIQHPELSLLFIEDEQKSKNIFARKRLILKCQCSLVDRNSEHWQQTLIDFEKVQGKTVSLLKTLPDFHLFELKATKGSYIKGFGQAFLLSGEGLNMVEAQDLKKG